MMPKKLLFVVLLMTFELSVGHPGRRRGGSSDDKGNRRGCFAVWDNYCASRVTATTAQPPTAFSAENFVSCFFSGYIEPCKVRVYRGLPSTLFGFMQLISSTML